MKTFAPQTNKSNLSINAKRHRFIITLCKETSTGTNTDPSSNGYLENLSFGKLLVPSASLFYTVSTSFAQLEYIHDKIPSKFVKKYCAHALDKYAPHSVISCTKHIDASRKILISTVINIFYNNKQHQSADEIRKQKIHGFKKRQRAKE